MTDVAIKVENLSKKYTIGKNKHSTLRETLSSIFDKIDREDFWALKDVDFSIKKGEAIGIVGSNGAGKSTLLKILSRITHPTEGRVTINGRLSSLLEVGTGFHPELTGRENVFLNGSLLGMTRSEIKSKFDEIVEFSGVSKFIDTPVKHYSSGMYVRLAFAVSAHLNTEILLIDEVLAVGDTQFQQKCIRKMNEVTSQGRTVLFVSHNFEAIKQLTSNCLLLDNGKLIKRFDSQKLSLSFISEHGEANAETLTNDTFIVKNININKNMGLSISFNERIRLSFSLISKKDLSEKSIMVAFENVLGERIFTSLSHKSLLQTNLSKNEKIDVDFDLPEALNLVPGAYHIVIGIIDPPYFLVEKIKIKSAFHISDFDAEGNKFEGFLGSISISPTWKIV